MKALLEKHASKLRFALVGIANTTIDFGLLFILVALGLDKILSNYIATTAAFIFSFFANRSYTFKSAGNIKKQIILFSIVTLFGLWVIQPIVITVTTHGLANLDLSNEITLLISKVLATGITLVWNYVFYSKLVFKS